MLQGCWWLPGCCVGCYVILSGFYQVAICFARVFWVIIYSPKSKESNPSVSIVFCAIYEPGIYFNAHNIGISFFSFFFARFITHNVINENSLVKMIF